jgi:hypothetical protein
MPTLGAMCLRLHVSDVRALPSLVLHLAEQGFPATDRGGGVVEVLFPAAEWALRAAAELDLWCAANAGVSLQTLPDAKD